MDIRTRHTVTVTPPGDGQSPLVTLSRALWENSAVPGSVYPIDSHQALRSHVFPPKPLSIPLEQHSQPSETDNPSSQVSEDVQALISLSQSAHAVASTSTAPSPSPSALPSHPLASDSPPSKRQKRTHSFRGLSSGQRGVKSQNALGFWNALGGKFRFNHYPGLVDGFIYPFRRQHLSEQPNKDASFLVHFLDHIVAHENTHSSYTEAGLTAMRDGAVFWTYYERDGHHHLGNPHSPPRNPWVNLTRLSGQEIGDQVETMRGVLGLANLYCRYPANFRPDVDLSYAYDLAPKVTSGISDFASRRHPSGADPEAEINKSTIDLPSPFLVEDKTKLTFRDVVCLIYVLSEGDMEIMVDKNGVHCQHPLAHLLSAVALALLAQLAQQLHVNKSRYVLLDLTDVYLLFELQNRTECRVSSIIFRDPETFHPLFTETDSLARILRLVQTSHRDKAITAASSGILTSPSRPSYTLLEILVAGLTVGPWEGGQYQWLTRHDIDVGVSQIKKSASGKRGNKGSSTRRSNNAPTEDVISESPPDSTTLSLGIDSLPESVNDDVYHPLHFGRMAMYKWTRDEDFQQSSAHHSSDDTNSSVPSLTTEETLPPSDPISTPTQDAFPPDVHHNHSPDSSTEPTSSPLVSKQASNRGLSTEDLSNQYLSNGDLSDDLSDGDVKLVTEAHPLSLSNLAQLQGSSTAADHSNPRLAAHHLTVDLQKLLGSGRLWDGYLATLSDGNATTPVCAKICNLASMPDDDDEVSPGYYNSANAASAINNEISLFLGPLKPLQGVVVPRLYDKWTGELDMYGVVRRYELVIMELWGPAAHGDAHPSPSSLCDLDATAKSNIIAAYTTIHSRGVLHHDVQPRHVLVDPKSLKVRIIDFESSTHYDLQSPEASAAFQAEASAEMSRVHSMLGVTK